MTVAAVRESSSQTLFVVPRGEGNGFRASVRGHVLDLIDPDSYSLAPTADDLFVVSIAAASAWAARGFLRDRGLPDYVSIAAERRTHEDPTSPWDISLTVTVSEDAKAEAAALSAAIEKSLAPRLTTEPVIHVAFDEGDRPRRTR